MQREQAMKRMLNNLIGGTPYNKPEEYKKRSAVNWADEIDVPLLILHAENDDQVDITQAERMINELDEANKEYDYYIYDRGGHDLGLYWFNVRKRTIDWFENHKR